MAGVDQGARRRSQDMTPNMRRVNALEDGVWFAIGSISSLLVASIDESWGLTDPSQAGTGGFYMRHFDQDEQEFVFTLYNSAGAQQAQTTYNGNNPQFLIRGPSLMYFVAGDFDADPAERWRLFTLTFGLGSETDKGETTQDIGVTPGAGYGNGKVWWHIVEILPFSSTVYEINPADGSVDSSFPVGGVGLGVSDDHVYTAVLDEIFQYNHSGTKTREWPLVRGIGVGVAFSQGHLIVLERSDNGSNYDWAILVFTPIGQLLFDKTFETNQSGSSRWQIVRADDLYNVYIQRNSLESNSGVYKLGPTELTQTTFHKYPTTSLGAKVSFGTPDGGASIPALTALEGIIPRSNEVTDVHDAIERVLSFYINGATGATFNLDAKQEASIIGATNASPIVITTSGAHGFSSYYGVTVAGVGGNTAANGNWITGNVGATAFELIASTGNGSYSGGGTVHNPNNLYDVGVEADVFDWKEDGDYKDIIREDLIDEIDGCLTELEASDLA